MAKNIYQKREERKMKKLENNCENKGTLKIPWDSSTNVKTYSNHYFIRISS